MIPSPWRASAGMLAPFVLLAAGLGVVIGLRSPVFGVLVAAVVLGIVGSAQLQAAFRLNWALREFARQIPGDPEADASVWGDQSLRWPDLGLEVSGSTYRFNVRGLTIELDGRSESASTMRPREAARETLYALGREPRFERLEDRLPSIYPRLSAFRTGVPVAAVVVVLAALATRDGSTAVVVGLGAGGIAGLVRWVGLRRVRRALVALADGLAAGGLEVVHVDLVRGIVSQRYEVHTETKAVTIRCIALPWGRLSARLGDRTLSRRFPGARTLGRDLAGPLSRLSLPERTDVSSADTVHISSTQRLSSLVFGAFFTGFGLVIVARPGVIVRGECEGEGCLLVDFIELVPFGNVVFGGLLLILGVVSLVLASVGTMPADAHRWWSRRYR